MTMDNTNGVDADRNAFMLKAIADTFNTTAEKAARVLSSISQEDLDFIIDNLSSSESEEALVEAANRFNAHLDNLEASEASE